MFDFDINMVNWARAQFAMTALYHWIFVPLTLGLSFLCAFFESIYVRTGNEEWKRLTRFWMTLFGINFAIGVATGIILEFEFGTNWSNYSWIVGDIFGTPLAIEGILAFFLEATFFAVMFFGWDRVSKGQHLFATWMVAVGSNLSALWILIANAWMQHPVGMSFNPDSARFEMDNFFALFSPTAISKFTHTTSSSFMVGSLFVIAISSWFLVQGRHLKMAKRSILVASIFGLLAGALTGLTGDEAAHEVAQNQPMKLAAFEGLYEGEKPASLVALGVLNPGKTPGDDKDPFLFQIKIPGLLSILANRDLNSFVPGIRDLVVGNKAEGIVGVEYKMARGKIAIQELQKYKQAKKAGDKVGQAAALALFNQNKEFLGYGHLQEADDVIPPVAITFYAFHLMVMIWGAFMMIFLLFLFFTFKDTITEQKILLYAGVSTFVLAIVSSQAGWIVAEVGRQPWAIQGLLPVSASASNISAANVQTTFIMFLVLFTLLLIAEVKIMLKQIHIGPEDK